MLKRPHRRQFLHLAAGAVALPAASRIARAQAYPTRPVRLVVGFAAGGADDIFARLIGQWLSERLGQTVLIENRTGAASMIAAEAVVRSPPDGYTLLILSLPTAISANIYDRFSFNLIRDIVPVAGLTRVDFLMSVPPTLPVTTPTELVAHAKANPGKINIGSAGIGSPQHVSAEMFKQMTGVVMQHVPYRGEAPMLSDLIAGQVQVGFSTIPSSLEYIRAGKLRALAVTPTRRSSVLPELPTMGNFVPGFEIGGWIGVGAPRGTPLPVIDRLNREINAGLANSGIAARYAELGVTALVGSAADFGRHVADETEKWGKVVRAANIKPE